MSAEPGFERTLATVDDAERIARLLERAAAKVGGGQFGDSGQLAVLSRRYRDYAEALRACVPVSEAEPAEDQAVLL